jgi:hypothetical protein
MALEVQARVDQGAVEIEDQGAQNPWCNADTESSSYARAGNRVE